MSEADKLRVAVIGAGNHGRFHVQKYRLLPGVDLVGVVDVTPARAQRLAGEFGAGAFIDHRALLGQVDAVSIVVPAHAHYAIARDFLAQGVHVLLEKPMATTAAQAEDLVALAAREHLVLQVGMLERFNPALLALEPMLTQPLFIESNRIAPFSSRGTDVSVVLDLMIHDIDLVLALVGVPLSHIDASGIAVLSADIDIANARLRFSNGCVANITASRVGAKSERTLRLFQRDAYFSVDLGNKRLTVRRKDSGEEAAILSEELTPPPHDALEREIRAFLEAIRTASEPVVGGAVGLRALQTALEITRLVQR